MRLYVLRIPLRHWFIFQWHLILCVGCLRSLSTWASIALAGLRRPVWLLGTLARLTLLRNGPGPMRVGFSYRLV